MTRAMGQRSQTEITAYHEAGHAVMAISTGFVVTEISCKASDDRYGHTAWLIPTEMTNAARVGAVLTLASGMAADYLHWTMGPERDDSELSKGHTGDRVHANIHLAELGQGQGDAFNDYLAISIDHLKKQEVWPFVVSFAEMLKITGVINGPEIFHKAMQHVPKTPAQQLELYKRAIDLKISRSGE